MVSLPVGLCHTFLSPLAHPIHYSQINFPKTLLSEKPHWKTLTDSPFLDELSVNFSP